MLAADAWTVREEKPVLIGRFWAPKPDIAVLRGSDETYATRHPDRAMSPCWLRFPTRPTIAIVGGMGSYASAGIPLYMIVRLTGPDTRIEVWTGPTGRAREAGYTDAVRSLHGPASRFPSSWTAASMAGLRWPTWSPGSRRPAPVAAHRDRSDRSDSPRPFPPGVPHDDVLSVSDHPPGRRGAGAFHSHRPRGRGPGRR